LSGGKGKKSKREKEMQLIDYSQFVATSSDDDDGEESEDEVQKKE